MGNFRSFWSSGPSWTFGAPYRIKPKHIYFGFLVIYGALCWFGAPLPKDLESTMDWLTSIDIWLLNHHAAYPGLFMIFVGLLIGTVIAPEGMHLITRHFNREHEHELAQHFADLRVGFVWENEAAPEKADYRFNVFARNLGPMAPADVSVSFAAFCPNTIGLPNFTNAEPRPIYTTLPPNNPRFNIWDTQLPDGKEGQHCYGFVRWSDGGSKIWERVFCVEVHPHHERNQFPFPSVPDER